MKSSVFSFFLIVSFSFSFEVYKKISFERFIEKLLNYKVIYLGEIHTSKEIHEFQLRVIKELYKRDRKLIIAMETFQQQFQEYLDRYIDCEITEEEMLRKTEYRKRWGFNKRLYEGIWKFAKERGIRLIALNVPSELLREVRKKGLENVKSIHLPGKIIYPPEEYRKFLIKQMKQHRRKLNEKRFIDIQTTWDNGMAYKIIKTLIIYPDHRIVVIVGKGHLYKGYGIPYVLKRFYKNIKQAIVYPIEEEGEFYYTCICE